MARESKQQYLARRRKRVHELYVNERLTPRQIAERLVAEGIIYTLDESLASATRLVQIDVGEIRADVAEIRAAIVADRDGDGNPAVAFNDLDAFEAELSRLRAERDRQLMIADGEPTEMCARSQVPPPQCLNAQCLAFGSGHVPYIAPAVGIVKTDTPQGPMVSYRALWPAGVRQKASKDAAILTRQISELEVRLAEKRLIVESKKDADSAGVSSDDVYRIRTSGEDFGDLVAKNADRPN